MKAVCPNDRSHNQFITFVQANVDWVVNQYGEFIHELDIVEYIDGPKKENIWTCNICGSQAIITEKERS